MNKFVIAIDCDDVIVPTAQIILKHYNEKYGTDIKLDQFYSKDPEVWNVDDMTVAARRVDDYLMTEEYQQTRPFKESIEAIHELAKYHELHLVTGRADFLSESTEKMLTENFPGLFKTLEFTNFYTKNPRSKADVCVKLKADYLIEDHLYHAQVVAECGTKVLLFGNYPWNQTETSLSANIRRVKDWNSVVTALIHEVQ